jgi:ATP-dependent Clp protease ATP-binding subunit ClpC
VLDGVMRVRRKTHRQLKLPRIVQLQDQTDYLVAQLGFASDKKKKKEAPDGRELGAMSADHARFAALGESLAKSFATICAVEELALSAFVAGEPMEAVREEADRAEKEFRAALVYALVAQEPKRNAATLMVKELDARRAFDHWLVPLLADATRRKWSITLHLDGDKEPPASGTTWASNLRWGPPRTPEQVLARLTDKERTFRNVILRVDGDHAAIWLALESGLHRFAGFSSGDPAFLHVQLMLLRSAVYEGEWSAPEMEPPNAQAADALTHAHPQRHTTSGVDEVHIAGGAEVVHLPFSEYWPSFEEIALTHLLLCERDLLDRDAQLSPLLNDEFREVKVLARAGNKIQAIKLYRQITGLGLKESKDAVDAME